MSVLSKVELRQSFLIRRKGISRAEAAAGSAAVGRRILAMESFCKAATIMAYIDVRGECQTGGLIRVALRSGKRVALPVPEQGTGFMVAALAADYPGGLVPGPYGIPMPRPGSRPVRPEEIDCILVPGLAYDPDGYRLGYGGGYYDRFLACLPAGAVVIGLAYGWQMLSSPLPREPHDRPVDVVVMPQGVLWPAVC